ncbi:C9H6ORF115 protein-like protein [Zopfochytrium polystomum]|nr:C9H6ORF115 protein-like protein [Zopfochytrium polystomum]
MGGVEEEIAKLIVEMKRLGYPNDSGQIVVDFGVLVRDDQIANILEGLVGTLRAAKKRKIVDYSGEMLLQGVHDKVAVTLLKDSV